MNDRYLYKAKRKHDSKFFEKGEWVEGAYYIEPYTDKCFTKTSHTDTVC